MKETGLRRETALGWISQPREQPSFKWLCTTELHFFYSSGGCKSKDKLLAGLVSPTLSPWLVDGHRTLTWFLPCAPVRRSPLTDAPVRVGEHPPAKTPSSSQRPCLQRSSHLRCGELDLQNTNLGGTKSAHNGGRFNGSSNPLPYLVSGLSVAFPVII